MPLTVDFSALFAAVRQMGAEAMEPPPLPPPGAPPLDPIDFELAETGIDVDLNDIDTTTGLLAYQGRQVLLYIQDHGRQIRNVLKDGSQGKKYHVAFCRTLSEMKAAGRFERYVATNDISGDFLISGVNIQTRRPDQGTARLQVCKNCLNYLNYQGYKQGHSQQYNSAIFNHFSLAEFFASYSSFFPHLPSRLAGGNDGFYTPDWPQISAQYRENQGFRCEQCGVQLAAHRHLLHTHHRNGVKTDNRPANFQALCLDCHRRQPAHDFMPVRHAEMQLITRLRREQAIRARDWRTTFELADPAVHGVLYHYRAKGWEPPELGYLIEDQERRLIGQLELAWLGEKLAVAIAEADRQAAQAQGWQVLSMQEATDQWQ